MHYYKANGDSCHEVVGKNGKTRPTTVRDARALGLFPSVTTIMDIQSKPALIQWLQNQVLEAAMASPFNAHEWEEAGWKKHIINKSREIGSKAAKRGNEIHDLMEKYFKSNGTKGYNTTDWAYIYKGIDTIEKQFPNYIWVAEASFAHNEGFGGRVDLHGYREVTPDCVYCSNTRKVESHDTKLGRTVGRCKMCEKYKEYVIIDFKTKDKTDVKDMVQYDDHCIQLAAYQIGLQLPENTRRFNLFISVNAETPGLCKLVECTKFDKYANIFRALVKLWQAKNSYTPEV